MERTSCYQKRMISNYSSIHEITNSIMKSIMLGVSSDSNKHMSTTHYNDFFSFLNSLKAFFSSLFHCVDINCPSRSSTPLSNISLSYITQVQHHELNNPFSHYSVSSIQCCIEYLHLAQLFSSFYQYLLLFLDENQKLHDDKTIINLLENVVSTIVPLQ